MEKGRGRERSPLWLYHNLELARYTVRRRRLVIAYEDLLRAPDWITREQIDKLATVRWFEHCTDATGSFPGRGDRGERSYMFVLGIGRDLQRYNPDLKLIVLLRDPVERAISHYYMEKVRPGDENAAPCGKLYHNLELARSRL